MWKTIIMFNMENYLDNYLESVHVHFDWAGSHRVCAAGFSRSWAPVFLCKISHKIIRVTCSCAFRLRRLAQKTGVPFLCPGIFPLNFRQPRWRSFRRFLPLVLIGYSRDFWSSVFHVLKLRLKQTKSDFWFDPTIWLVRLNLSVLRKKKSFLLRPQNADICTLGT